MKCYEITVTTYLKDDIQFDSSQEIIGKVISKAMYLDDKLKKKHESTGYKLYSFNNFFPIEKDKIYRNGRIYVFKIRGLEEDFILKLSELLTQINVSELKVVSTSIDIINKKHIKELISLTPVIITVDDGPWLKSDELITMVQRLNDNARKKYETFMKERISEDIIFIDKFKFLNKKPVSIKYKDMTLLGNKLKIVVNKNVEAQKLAFIAYACGLGEKNSTLGAGFCNWR